MTRKFPIWSLCLAAAVAFMVAAPRVSAQATAGEPASTQDAVADGVVAFYFHGNVRCATCRKIEAYADEAIHSGFASALEDGALVWRVVNIDEPEDKHFIEDFELVTRSVVLAEYRDGEVLRWKKLDKVWQLVRSKDDFVEYVQDEASEFLARTSHQLSAAAGDAQHPAVFSRLGVLDVLSSTPPRPSGRNPHWAQHLAALAKKPGEKRRLEAG